MSAGKMFHRKLFDGLNNQNQQVLSWSLTSDEVIINPKKSKDLKLIFNHANLASFYKQCKNYNFNICPTHKSVISHPLFKRGRPDLLNQLESSLELSFRKKRTVEPLAPKVITIPTTPYNDHANYIQFLKIFKVSGHMPIREYSKLMYLRKPTTHIEISSWEDIEHLFK